MRWMTFFVHTEDELRTVAEMMEGDGVYVIVEVASRAWWSLAYEPAHDPHWVLGKLESGSEYRRYQSSNVFDDIVRTWKKYDWPDV